MGLVRTSGFRKTDCCKRKLNAEQLEELNLQHREYVQRKHENQYQQMTLFAAENEGEDGNE